MEEEDQMFVTIFKSREELLDSVRDFYFKKGYATTIKKSTKEYHVRIGCDRGGCYRNMTNIPLELRKRNTSSRRINCPFKLLGKKQRDGKWQLQLINVSHNHEASNNMSGHPYCRRLSKEETESVEKMAKSGISPRQIISSLRLKNPNLQANSETIYNAIRKIEKDNLGDCTVIQALFEELDQGEFIFNVMHNENSRITHLFFAHPTSIVLARNFANVFVIDCTYKTSKYKMPLLDIVGVSCFNCSFYSCFTFMEKERKEDYIWALNMLKQVIGCDLEPSVIVSDREMALMNAIQIVFPKAVNLLCVWHIEKNILANCKHYFDSHDEWEAFLSSWNRVIQSSSDASFDQNWKLFEELYRDKKVIFTYIRKTWLPFKERFVYAWTKKYLHFGNRVSSRAEGAHAKLKKYLQVLIGDFRKVKSKTCLAIDNEFQELKSQGGSEKLRYPHIYQKEIFKELVPNVSMFSMKALYKQYEMYRDGTMKSACSNQFMSTMGLHCAHEIMKWNAGVIPLSFIHSQWRIDTWSLESNDRGILCTPHSLLLEPTIITSQMGVSSKKRKGSSSTKRDPSKFENEEKRTRKCSRCHGVGHYIRKCPNKSSSSVQNSCSIPNSVDK